MKKVITTVGTSLFANYQKDNSDIWHHYEQIKEEPFAAYEHAVERIKRVKQPVLNFACNQDESCAEIKSILKIKEELKESVDVYLLASDSITSALAAEIVKEALEKRKDRELRVNFNQQLDVIKGLQVNNQDEFSRSGMPNLVRRIYGLADGGYFGHLILNITGGYKATIPFLTVLGQVSNVPLYYIFEETQSLIKIPQTPVDIDWKTIGKHHDILERLEREGIIKEDKKYPETIESLIERAGDCVILNTLGIIFLERYKAKFEIFHLYPDEYMKYASLNEYDQRLFNRSLKELKRRLETNPGDPDLRHGLTGCSLPEGFYCFKHKEENEQVRILWRVNLRKSFYGSTINDFYIAMVFNGSEVHNSESEYVATIDRFTKKHPALNLVDFKVISIDKEEVGDV